MTMAVVLAGRAPAAQPHILAFDARHEAPVLQWVAPAKSLRTVWVTVAVAPPAPPDAPAMPAPAALSRLSARLEAPWQARFEASLCVVDVFQQHPAELVTLAEAKARLDALLDELRQTFPEAPMLVLIEAPEPWLFPAEPAPHRAFEAIGAFRAAAANQPPPAVHRQPPPSGGAPSAHHEHARSVVWVRGPAFDAPESPAFVVLAAEWHHLLQPGIEVTLTLRETGWWLRLTPHAEAASTADDISSARATMTEAISVLRAMRPTPQGVRERLDEVLMRRSLDAEDGRQLLAFAARRLRLAPATAVWAEEAALAIVQHHHVERARLQLLHQPDRLFVELPPRSAPALQDPTVAPAAAPRLLTLSAADAPARFEAEVLPHTPTVALAMAVGLPGAPPPARHVRHFLAGGREVPVPWITREEAALAWRARVAQVLRQHPGLARHVRVEVPSPLPGLTDDPTASNQYSGVVLTATAPHAGAMFELATRILAAQPSPRGIDEAVAQLLRGFDLPVQAMYHRRLHEQALIVAETPAAGVFERRRDAMASLAREGHARAWAVGNAFESLEVPGNFAMVAVLGEEQLPAAEALAGWLGQRSTRGAGGFPPVAPWALPGARLFTTASGQHITAHLLVPVPQASRPAGSAALLMLAEALNSHLESRLPGRRARVALLTFHEGTALYARCEGLEGTDALLRRSLIEALAAGPESGSFHARREALLTARQSTTESAATRAMMRTRDILLHGEPHRRDAIGQAIGQLTPQHITPLAHELRQAIEALQPGEIPAP